MYASIVAVKNYVLDTNVLLHDPRAFYAFADNSVVIPIFVIEEIDTFKKDQNELGRNARQVARLLDQHRSHDGGLSNAQPLGNGGTVRVALAKNPTKNPSYDSRSMDQRILEIACEVRDADRGTPTILVTKDVNMRIRGDALGLQATDFEPEQIQIDELYSGNRELAVPSGTVEQFYADGNSAVDAPNLYANEFLTLREDSGKSALARWDKPQAKALPVKKLRDAVWGIKPRNKEQHFALDLVLNDDIKLVTLVGKAGTGKTLLAIAAGLQEGDEERSIAAARVAAGVAARAATSATCPATSRRSSTRGCSRSTTTSICCFGLDKNDQGTGAARQGYAGADRHGLLEIEPLTYIRGRSLPNVYMIVDEAQNLTPHEVKTIITRAGEGTKIILTGDPYQIDHPYLDSSNNGLTTVVERFKNEAIAGHVILTKGERSPLAELATQIL